MTMTVSPLTLALSASAVTIEAAVAVLEMNGYKVTAPRAARAVRAGLRMEAPPKTSYKNWERQVVEFTFADGVVTRAYAMREGPTKRWFTGSAARAACDKYRYRATAVPVSTGRYAGTVFAPIDSVECPHIVSIEGIAVDISDLNEAMADYFQPSRNRFAA